MITIEKGKYTTLLRRVLGMRMSENGTESELEAILNNIQSAARYAKSSVNSKDDIEGYLENIGFAMEYYSLRREEIWAIQPEMENIPVMQN